VEIRKAIKREGKRKTIKKLNGEKEQVRGVGNMVNKKD
jgi:hypothetical protein